MAGHTRQLDPTRPVTLVCNAQWDQVSSPATQRGHVSRVTCQDHASQHFDIVAINRYYAWYSDPGHTEVIAQKLYSDLANWRRARGGRGTQRLAHCLQCHLLQASWSC